MPVEVELIDKIPLLRARVESTCRAAVMKVAWSISREARSNAPVDTGYLRSSISPKSLAYGKEAEIEVGAPYGGFVEFGTRHMVAQPFLGPAIEAHKEELLPEIAVAFEESL